MDGVGSVLSTQGVDCRAFKPVELPSPGALAACKQRVAESLSSTGFINVAGQMSENFEVYLDSQPFEIDVGELKPDTLEGLASTLESELAKAPQQAKRTQARVPPERAVKLLK